MITAVAGYIIVGSDQFDEPLIEPIGTVSQAMIDSLTNDYKARLSALRLAVSRNHLSRRYGKRQRQIRNGKAGRVASKHGCLLRQIAKTEKIIAKAAALMPSTEAMPSFGTITSSQAFKTVTSIRTAS